MSTVAAMPKPKKAPNIRNMMMLALAVAASALLPRNCPTQIELTEPDNVCRMFDASVGSAKRIKVFVIGPSVRSIRPPPREVWRGGPGLTAGSAGLAIRVGVSVKEHSHHSRVGGPPGGWWRRLGSTPN